MPIEEIRRMLKIGMTPMEVIIASTINAAEACGLEDEIGTLEIGKKADVIVVKGNPLDDISVLGSVLVVIKNGETEVRVLISTTYRTFRNGDINQTGSLMRISSPSIELSSTHTSPFA